MKVVARKLRFFRQHSLETCGISCILMILDYYHRVQYPTVKQERKLYGIYRSRAFCGVQAASAAECLYRNGLNVALYHESPALIDNNNGYYPEKLYQSILLEYNTTLDRIRDQVPIETGCSLTPEWVIGQLAPEKLLMLQCIVPVDADGLHDHVLHWVLCYGYRDGQFQVCDPLSRKITLTAAELEYYMDTPVGRATVVVSGQIQHRTN